MFRDIGYYRLRLAIFFTIALTLDALFYRIDNTFTSIAVSQLRDSSNCLFSFTLNQCQSRQDRVAVMLFVSGFLTFMSISGFPSFVEDIKVGYCFFLLLRNLHSK